MILNIILLMPLFGNPVKFCGLKVIVINGSIMIISDAGWPKC